MSDVLPIDDTTASRASEPHAAPTGEPRRGFLGWLAGAVPTFAVLVGLGGLAYWGHETEWTFSTAVGSHAAREIGRESDGQSSLSFWAEDAPRSVPTSGWCPDHGVFDCPLCHPEVAQLDKPSVISTADRERAKQTLAVRSRPTNDPNILKLPRVIRFVSAEAVEKAGIDVAPVWQTAMTDAVAASGELGFEPTRVARLTSRVAGTAWKVERRVGERVKAGDVLALVDAAEVGRAKVELLQALVQVRLKAQELANLNLAPKGVAERQRVEAQAALRDAEVRRLSAEQALVNLGLPARTAEFDGLTLDAVADRLQRLGLTGDLSRPGDPTPAPGTLLPVRSPIDGVVMQVDVIAGEAVDAAKVLFVVADPSRLWLTLHVSPDDIRWVAVSQPVRFRPDGSASEVNGRVIGIGTAADETTRTVPVRAEVGNEVGRLRAYTFGVGRVVLREEPTAIVVPHGAVHTLDGTTLVFVRDKDYLKPDGPTTFHVRTVRVGAKDAENTEILAGVLPGEIVAVKGSGLLLDELRKTRISSNTAK